jgi:hypothetical protein
VLPHRSWGLETVCAAALVAGVIAILTTSVAAATTTDLARRPVPMCFGLRATKVGTPGRDVIRGTRRRDVIAARGGNDLILGLGGNDVICGGAGNDRIWGGTGSDRIDGGPGVDVLDAELGFGQVVVGGAGFDLCLNGTRYSGCERNSVPLPPTGPPQVPCTPDQCPPTPGSSSSRLSIARMSGPRRAAVTGSWKTGVIDCSIDPIYGDKLVEGPPAVTAIDWGAGVDRDRIWWDHQVWEWDFQNNVWHGATSQGNWASVVANDQDYADDWIIYPSGEPLGSWSTDIYGGESSFFAYAAVNFLYWYQGNGNYEYQTTLGTDSDGNPKLC